MPYRSWNTLKCCTKNRLRQRHAMRLQRGRRWEVAKAAATGGPGAPGSASAARDSGGEPQSVAGARACSLPGRQARRPSAQRMAHGAAAAQQGITSQLPRQRHAQRQVAIRQAQHELDHSASSTAGVG